VGFDDDEPVAAGFGVPAGEGFNEIRLDRCRRNEPGVPVQKDPLRKGGRRGGFVRDLECSIVENRFADMEQVVFRVAALVELAIDAGRVPDIAEERLMRNSGLCESGRGCGSGIVIEFGPDHEERIVSEVLTAQRSDLDLVVEILEEAAVSRAGVDYCLRLRAEVGLVEERQHQIEEGCATPLPVDMSAEGDIKAAVEVRF